MPNFSISRSTSIEAPVEKVHATLRNFRSWPTWSPWLIAEPTCRLTYAADGRSYAWDGKIVGSGEMTITRDEAPRAIHYRLTFLKPWKSVSDVSFTLKEKDGGTHATWTMDGSVPFFLFWMKKTMTTYIGMDYERGLHMLKSLMETGKVPSKLEFPGPRLFSGLYYVGVKSSGSTSDIGPRMEKDFERLKTWLNESKTQPSGKPFTIYHHWDPVRASCTYTLGFPVKSPPSGLPAEIVTGDIPPCEVYLVRHTGSYSHLGNAWAAGIMHARNKAFTQNRSVAPFEIYESDPNGVPESDLLTIVHFPAK